MSHAAQPRTLRVTMPIKALLRPGLLRMTAFSPRAGARKRGQWLDLLETQVTIDCRPKPAQPEYLHLPAPTQPRLAKIRHVAVPCRPDRPQMLSYPAIHHVPATAGRAPGEIGARRMLPWICCVAHTVMKAN